ncbi:unnamed protein product [Eruca vesicaria subsp. sativa]|uniref:Uncharacterized protein n=1 Tax=Eruca vesicaria subsp. sativa TaxID=29727 RepID=A0ABC8K7S9_ERUVS|nr:unnamed protein product [Eruca vesicaria subsp. sativa]
MATHSSPLPPRPQKPSTRKPTEMPFSSFRPKPKRKSSCRTCCCCLCITLVFLVATAVFYHWFDPNLPTFSLFSFRFDRFKLSNDLDGASLCHGHGRGPRGDEEPKHQTRFLLRKHHRGNERRQRKLKNRKNHGWRNGEDSTFRC